MSDVSESLRLLTKNEQPWAIRSGRSEEMSDVSESLISLTKNEPMSKLLIFLSELLIFLSKSLIFWANRSFAHFWTKNERFAQKTD